MSIIGFSNKAEVIINCEKICGIDFSEVKEKLNKIKMESTATHLAIEEANALVRKNS